MLELGPQDKAGVVEHSSAEIRGSPLAAASPTCPVHGGCRYNSSGTVNLRFEAGYDGILRLDKAEVCSGSCIGGSMEFQLTKLTTRYNKQFTPQAAAC